MTCRHPLTSTCTCLVTVHVILYATGLYHTHTRAHVHTHAGGAGGATHINWAAQQLEAAVLEAMRAHLPQWAGNQIPAECRPPPEAFNLMARMLAYDPEQRISAEEALGHEYFTKGPRPSANVFVAPVGVGCWERLVAWNVWLEL